MIKKSFYRIAISNAINICIVHCLPQHVDDKKNDHMRQKERRNSQKQNHAALGEEGGLSFFFVKATLHSR